VVRRAHVAWSFAVAGAAAVACGARTGLLVPVGSSDAGTSCRGVDIPLEPNTPNLYFVLDRSGSMAEMNKWPNMRSVIADLMTELGPRAQFGAALFPTSGGDDCATGGEVMPVQLGDTTGATAGVFLAATSLDPNGGTPTAATLEALTPELAAFPQRTVAILATDGGPNCDPALSCDASTCTSNMDDAPGCPTGGPPNCCDPTTGIGGIGCLDGMQSVLAVEALATAGVQTFVLGIPGSAPYAAVLDSLAQAGGTARPSEPHYYSVDTADTSALAAAFAQVAAQATASCSFVLSRAPTDPNEVNVYVGGPAVPRDGPNGWTLQGTKLTLLGSACAAVQGADAQAILVLEGCVSITQ
jgi:hypothetical protein